MQEMSFQSSQKCKISRALLQECRHSYFAPQMKDRSYGTVVSVRNGRICAASVIVTAEKDLSLVAGLTWMNLHTVMTWSICCRSCGCRFVTAVKMS